MARAWHLASRPQGMPTPANFELKEVELPSVGEGMLRVRNRWLSVDPAMRGRMNDVKSYVPPFQVGAPLEGRALAEVIESRASGFAAGDLVRHSMGWRDEAVAPADAFEKLPQLDVPDELHLSHLGATGMTAYFGLLEVAQAKAGDIVFVSAAAGAVGSAVVQIAKLKGMTVIGSAGGPEKVALVKSLGADAAFDYKAEGSLLRKLRAAAPDGIDVFFDNVGGDHLDAALAHARENGRFALCGMIVGYNNVTAEPTPMRNLIRIITAKLRLRGFLLREFDDRQEEFRRDMAGWIKDGLIRQTDTIHEGLEATPDALLGLFSGGNTGKMLVRL